MDHFELVSEYQPQAIDELVRGFREGNQFQTDDFMTFAEKIRNSKSY